MYDAVVVGAGIFGSLITRALRRSGLTVLTVDDRRPDAGSAPAACLMRPSWFSSLGKEVYEPALSKLDELVGVQELSFTVAPTNIKTKVSWCDPKKVLLDQSEVRTVRVSRIERVNDGWFVAFDNSAFDTGLVRHPLVPVSARMVIVAAGIWTPMLVPEVDVVGQAGIAWLWPSDDIAEPFIRVWAPYKQIVAFNRGDGLWVGDGTTVRHWNETHRNKAYTRCKDAVGKTKSAPIGLFGYRPYVQDAKPCFLKEVKKGFWVATGGAKNGTLAAGWCADQITKAVA